MMISEQQELWTISKAVEYSVKNHHLFRNMRCLISLKFAPKLPPAEFDKNFQKQKKKKQTIPQLFIKNHEPRDICRTLNAIHMFLLFYFVTTRLFIQIFSKKKTEQQYPKQKLFATPFWSSFRSFFQNNTKSNSTT